MPDDSKEWYASKTIWSNIVAVAASFFTDFVGPEQEVAVLGVINLILRFITKSKIKW